VEESALVSDLVLVVDGLEAAGLALEVEDGLVGVVGGHHVAAAFAEVDAEDADGLLFALRAGVLHGTT